MKWIDKDIEVLKLYLEMGKNYKEIGVYLQRSAKSVKEKANKLGFKYSDYNKTEKYCLECGCYITSNTANKFCNRSCAAIFNNKKFPKRKSCKEIRTKQKSNSTKNEIVPYCLICNTKKVSKNKTCSKECMSKHLSIIAKQKRDKKVENGEATSKMCRFYLIEKFGHSCMKCGWSGIHPISKLPIIDLEHKDGNSENNELSNLELLCPNCHAMTPTYKALNKGKGRHKRRERYQQGKSF